MARICLVSCVRSKQSKRATADDLYTSSLFKKAREYAIRNFDRWFILSAKYHLLAPETSIEPYEKSLIKMTHEERSKWAKVVYAQILAETSPKDEITFLAGEKYRENLEPLLNSRGNKVRVPMRGMSIGMQLQWLNSQNGQQVSKKALENFYAILARLEIQIGGARILRGCSGKQIWPQRGIYFLLEPNEYRSASLCGQYRIVRVGTHMVSRGSKATLWNRLRTHRGHSDGTGNHRASVFRRHIGEAIMGKEGDCLRVPTWGKGQTAPPRVLRKEMELEQLVSDYIGRMSVVFLEVRDDPGPSSDRAYLERHALALLASEGRKTDPPSHGWLGNFSPTQEIRISGLWNVDHVSHSFDRRFLDVFEAYVNVQEKKRSMPSNSLAPKDWYLRERKKVGRGQMSLFKEG